MTAGGAAEAPAAVPFGEAARYWLKLGFIDFGGPAGQIALMHAELVERRRWISEKRFLHALNYCMVLPGPEAQQLATYLGWLMHRTWGGVVAGGLFVLPSLCILIALSWIYLAFGDVPAVAGFLYGVKPAVTAIVVVAAVRIARRALAPRWLAGVAIAAFVALFVFALPYPLIVVGAGVIGWLGGRIAPGGFAPKAASGDAARASAPALIDDATPTPRHALFSWRRVASLLAVCLGLWALAIAGLAAAWGWDGALTRMAWFFTKAALLTFGGAYAVLPYVVQGAVEQHGWLSTGQMIDGLALGETTPGPLIMVVAFVGFVGGWNEQLFGADARALAGAAAAGVVAFFTFLPSFFFIFLGGPVIESTHGRLGFTAPLAGITAAVVGVIAHLAIFFAGHVLWPHGLSGRFEWPAALVGLVAALALGRWRVGVVPVVMGSGLAGLAIQRLTMA